MIKYNSTKKFNEWSKLINNINESNIDEIVDKFCVSLQKDLTEQVVSDCAINCPRHGGSIDKKYKLAHLIAFKLFPKEAEKDKKWAYVKYSKLISLLSLRFKTHIEKIAREQEELKKVQKYNRKNFCTLKNKPLSKQILEPTPMEVSVAPLSELEPFFDFMKSNKQVDEEYQQFVRGTMFKDGRLDMCKQVVGSPYIGNLMDSIKNNDNVQHFLMGNNVTGREGSKNISEFIKSKHNSKIETWYLAGSEFGPDDIKLISDALKNDNDCKALWLKRNPIMSEGCKYLGEMLEHNKNIKILDLHNCGILNEGCKYLFKSLTKNSSLKNLYLDANGIDQNGIDCICEYFDYLVSNNIEGITSLWLSMNRLCDEGVIKLSNSLKNYRFLKRIDLGSNRIENFGANILFENLVDLPKLKMFGVGWYKSTADMGELPNNISDVAMLCKFIESNKSCKVINLQNNNLSIENLESILNSLNHNNNIVYIYYEQYGLDIPKHIHQGFRNIFEQNIKINYNVDCQYFVSNILRYIKHTNRVKHIDSIYRNKM